MTINRAHVLLKDDRQDLRIKESGQIPWQIKYKQREGNARIRNISVSGMMIETDTSFNQKDECILSFDSDPEAGIYIPQVGRLVWHKKKPFSRNKYLCGIKFMEADEQVLTRMRSKVQKGVAQFVKERKVTSVAGSVLAIILIASIGILVWFGRGIYQDIVRTNEQMLSNSNRQITLSQTYGNLYRGNEAELKEVTRRLNITSQLVQEDKAAIALFTQELEATKALLSQTESMLIQANDRNVEMSSQLELAKVGQGSGNGNSQVLLPNEDVRTVEDARALMASYKLKLRSLKGEIKRMKIQERSTRTTLLAQFDDQKLLLGNNGYFVKNGFEVQSDQAQYQNLTLGQLQGKNVEIDVTFFD